MAGLKIDPRRAAAGATVALAAHGCVVWLVGTPAWPTYEFGLVSPFILGPLLFLFGLVAVWVNWRWGLWAFVQVAVLVVAVIYGYVLELERVELERMREEAAAERAASAPP